MSARASARAGGSECCRSLAAPSIGKGQYWARMTAAAAPDVLWTPSEARIERATITRYIDWLARARELRLDSYDELWGWSVSDLEGFWSSIVECFGIRFETPPERVLGKSSMPGAEWFPGSRLSYPEHIFRG